MDDGRAPGGSAVLESCTDEKKIHGSNMKYLRHPHSCREEKKYWGLL
jgi:hypothetical protein